MWILSISLSLHNSIFTKNWLPILAIDQVLHFRCSDKFRHMPPKKTPMTEYFFKVKLQTPIKHLKHLFFVFHNICERQILSKQVLTHQTRKLPSYRNQSMDLLCKSKFLLMATLAFNELNEAFYRDTILRGKFRTLSNI